MLVFEVVAILVTAMICMVIAYFVGRKQGLENRTEDFRCLYCDTLVIGAKSADKMVHILCIDRAPGDLEAIKKSAIGCEDNYFMDFKPVNKKHLSEKDNQSNWRYQGTAWTSTQGDLYRNGEKITSWTSLDKEVLKDRLNAEMELDKHKRKTKALN